MSNSNSITNQRIWNFNKFADNVAVIVESGEKYTYSQLKSQCDELYGAIGRRCLAVNFCTNTIGSLVGYLSFVSNGIVPIMVDATLEQELLQSLLEKYKPQYYWLPDALSNRVSGWKVYSSLGYSLIRSDYNDEYTLYGELALLLTTSGSTGSPKLVRQTYKNIEANTRSIVEYLRLDSAERPITTLPMNYTYGLSIINTHLYVGASIILTEKTLMQKEFWQQFKSYGATSFGGVPYIYEMLDKLRFFRMDLPSLRTMTQAGGKLSPELHKKFAEYALSTGKKFIVMYGQTEATARMAYLPADKALEKYGSMGIAIPGGKFTLIDVDGKEITEPNVDGELVYEGDNVTLGYATCGEDLIKGDEWHGRNVTGDMARRDSDGYYYITGRKKRFLKIFGSRVNLDETERLVKNNFPEFDCVCGGVDDKMFVFITNKDRTSEVKRFLSEKLSLNSVAFDVRYIDAVPRNESGKVLYKDLEKHYS